MPAISLSPTAFSGASVSGGSTMLASSLSAGSLPVTINGLEDASVTIPPPSYTGGSEASAALTVEQTLGSSKWEPERRMYIVRYLDDEGKCHEDPYNPGDDLQQVCPAVFGRPARLCVYTNDQDFYDKMKSINSLPVEFDDEEVKKAEEVVPKPSPGKVIGVVEKVLLTGGFVLGVLMACFGDAFY